MKLFHSGIFSFFEFITFVTLHVLHVLYAVHIAFKHTHKHEQMHCTKISDSMKCWYYFRSFASFLLFLVQFIRFLHHPIYCIILVTYISTTNTILNTNLHLTLILFMRKDTKCSMYFKTAALHKYKVPSNY